MQITHDSVALITGANGGIGRAIAKSLKAAGAQILLTGRRPDALAPVAEETGGRVIVADLAKDEDVKRCVEEACAVDILVLNAALPASGLLMEFTPEQIDRALDVNLRAPIVMARAIGEGMVKRGRGQIIFISSISGKVAAYGTSMYSATKFGMRGFSLALREDLRGTGVGVTTVFPGFIRDAGMFAETGIKLPAAAGTRTPEDVAAAVMRAVRYNPDEIDVAALEQTLGALIAGISPRLVSTLQRWSGGVDVAKKMIEAQKHKR